MIKRKNIKLIKNNNGITLIALVITIIVLIILAGVSIKIILGDNGLVEKTKYAKEQQTIETIREKLDIVKGSDYIEQEGNNSIDTYFETLEKEKIEPYTITNKQKVTENTGLIEVNNKYSYVVTIENNNDIKIKYEGKVDEIIREPDEVTITITGEKEQANLPVTLNASIKINGEDVTTGKYVINTIAEEIGIEDDIYTKQITDSNIDVTLEQANTYYIHTLTISKYGKKQETIKGPITVTAKYHTHIGDSTKKEGCYTIEKYETKSVSCGFKMTARQQGNDWWWYCDYHGAQRAWTQEELNKMGISSSTIFYCGQTTTKSVLAGYNLGCGKTETTIEGYIVNY